MFSFFKPNIHPSAGAIVGLLLCPRTSTRSRGHWSNNDDMSVSHNVDSQYLLTGMGCRGVAHSSSASDSCSSPSEAECRKQAISGEMGTKGPTWCPPSTEHAGDVVQLLGSSCSLCPVVQAAGFVLAGHVLHQVRVAVLLFGERVRAPASWNNSVMALWLTL